MKRNLERLALLAACGLIGYGATGCSISKSSETISDSISSPFKWSSDSSGSDEKETAYQRDVSHYAASFVRDGGDLDAFRAGVRQLAEARGITNWESDAATCESIGRGLQVARLDPAEMEGFADALLGDHPRSVAALRAGYASIP